MPGMIITDAHDELGEIVEEIAQIEHTESIRAVLDACFHRLHFIARAALASGDNATQARAWGMATAIRQIVEGDENTGEQGNGDNGGTLADNGRDA